MKQADWCIYYIASWESCKNRNENLTFLFGSFMVDFPKFPKISQNLPKFAKSFPKFSKIFEKKRFRWFLSKSCWKKPIKTGNKNRFFSSGFYCFTFPGEFFLSNGVFTQRFLAFEKIRPVDDADVSISISCTTRLKKRNTCLCMKKR